MSDSIPSLPDAPSPGAPPQDASPPTPPEAPAPHLTPAYREHVDALLRDKVAPTEGTADLVEDLKSCAQRQAEARQALQQASQFVQAKQGEVLGLEGEAAALMRVLKRAEERAAPKT